MQIYWPKFLLKILFWLSAEIALTCLGLDDLADYSEFLLQDRNNFLSPATPIELVTEI
ncbi:hypothetical protein N836_32345 [Leptolyngbya sp. Heron Island J]|nr:hypothetical protein N836_19900 [Leptolyngbya sp. Heron Island J]ESA36518.1 hypothetical protein N836_07430 [Leptolyngbya sp. Heron Island J]ESA37762.1 hypothetical protein N836_35185 [Leptolyngbya sp. Heron Island J]ESA38124.1 hypothetical protein N836_32345 [Leptolyngbya sp. Heron Island J]